MQILGIANSYASAPVNAPTSLSAIPTNTTVAISFTAPTNNGGSDITNYEYSFNLSSWTAISPADAVSPVTVSGLTQNTAYTIYLRAVNIVGSGPASSGVAFTTEGVPTGTPTITSVPVDVTTATVNYTYPGGGGAVTGWDLYVANQTNSWNNTTASPISVSGLTANSYYVFYVRAKNAYGVGPQSAGFGATTLLAKPTSVEFLVIAGGGSGGGNVGGGGGAGGYRTSVGTSGRGAGAEGNYSVPASFTVTVGGGGGPISSGSASVMGGITSTGGGAGGTFGGGGAATGGAGGGAGANQSGASGTAAQGYDGAANSGSGAGNWRGGGGGGAGGNGAGGSGIGYGGAGQTNSITTASVTRAGGGGGGGFDGGTPGSGGSGGGGGGGQTGSYGGNGTGNTGSGGGGTGNYPGTFAGSGGSGIVIFRYSNTLRDITSISGGLGYSYANTGGYKIYTFTSGTGTVTV